MRIVFVCSRVGRIGLERFSLLWSGTDAWRAPSDKQRAVAQRSHWDALGQFTSRGVKLLGWAVSVLVWMFYSPAETHTTASRPFRLPPNFVMELFADEKLANDIYAMTLDEQGRVVVTSAGYIKRLEDTDGDGRADRVVLLGTPLTGGMGLFCDGEYLYYCGDGWLSRYRRVGPEGQLAAEPEKIIPLAFGEHGGHAMRQGPDGWWYVMTGNDARVGAELITDPRSPIRQPQAGCLLRLRPNPAGKPAWQVQVVAHGFRNPYDFDFGLGGELFTYDSDVERTFLLPWYTPTRIYHIAWGGHHGWRLPGYLRSWARCQDYLDTVEVLWPIGRGSPTGVVVYQHWQFPEKYRGGLFVADWTFGRIYFVALTLHGSSYRGQPEVFLEPTGQEGFAPTDLAVGKNGELFVSIGGRRTRGAVYRIRYVGATKAAERPRTKLEAVLRAPQPLDAWSRASWQPLARDLGKAAFLQAVLDPQRSEHERIRAIEVATGLFDGLDDATAAKLADDASALVRASLAWSLSCSNLADTGTTKGERSRSDKEPSTISKATLFPVLVKLAQDAHPLVRRRALEALTALKSDLDEAKLVDALLPNLDNSDKRVRQAAARLASILGQQTWERLWSRRPHCSLTARLTLCLACCWRHDLLQPLPEVAEEAACILESEKASMQARFEALRLVMLAYGDWELDKPPVEVLTGYTLRHPVPQAMRQRLARAIHRYWPASEPRWDQEAARLLAMVRDDSPDLPKKLASLWTENSDPTWDLHYLIVLACSSATWPDQLPRRVSDVLVNLQERLEGKQLRIKLTWGDRLGELVHLLVQRQPQLASLLAKHPKLVQPGHIFLALALPATERQMAAERFLQTAVRDDAFAWTPALLDLFSSLPPEKALPAFRSRLTDPALRYVVLVHLAKHAAETDRLAFAQGLEAPQPEVVRACVEALERLPSCGDPQYQAWLLRGLRSCLGEPRQQNLRQRIARLYCQSAGIATVPRETQTDSKSLREVYRPLWEAFLRQHPELAQVALADDASDDHTWRKRLAQIDWSQGNAVRGEALFRQRGCLTCHAGSSRIGPDLAGVTNRFSREDLFEAILFPSREVAPAYRMELVETRSGQVYTGIVIFESADGIILQTDATTTIRIAAEDLLQRSVSRRSLMPDGLLKDLTDRDYADLYAFLQTLRPGTILAR